MSRKTILTVTAVIGAILVVITKTFGLALNAMGFVVGLTAVLLYVFLEGKADIKKLSDQATKWKDPKFWLTVISAVLGALATSGVPLPVSPEIIIAVLTAIVGVLFGKQAATT
jgi:membrane associated rhomboid family serine protease